MKIGFFSLNKATGLGEGKLNLVVDLEMDGFCQVIHIQDTLRE